MKRFSIGMFYFCKIKNKAINEKFCGYHLEDHHNALVDAEACAAIAIKLNLGSKSMI